MGIKGLGTLVNCVKRSNTLNFYRNKKLAIDASIYMYSFLRQPRKNALINGFWSQIQQFKKYNITPIYILDGKASKAKLVTKERSKIRKEKSQKLIKMHNTFATRLVQVHNKLADNANVKIITRELSTTTDVESPQPLTIKEAISTKIRVEDIENSLKDSELDEKNKRNLIKQIKDIKESQQELTKEFVSNRYPTYKDKVEMFKLFNLCQVPYIQAEVESDVVCAYLSANGHVDGVVSTDFDFLTFGCTRLIRGLKNDSDKVEEYVLFEILEKLGITFQQFVELCILCGCDYATKIEQIGPKRALNHIKKLGTIEKLVEKIDGDKKMSKKHFYDEDFLDQVKVSRQIFGLEYEDYKLDPDVLLSLTEVEPGDWKDESERLQKLEKFLQGHEIDMKKRYVPMTKKIGDYFMIKKDED